MFEMVRIGLLKTAFGKLTAILFKFGCVRPLRPSRMRLVTKQLEADKQRHYVTSSLVLPILMDNTKIVMF